MRVPYPLHLKLHVIFITLAFLLWPDTAAQVRYGSTSETTGKSESTTLETGPLTTVVTDPSTRECEGEDKDKPYLDVSVGVGLILFNILSYLPQVPKFWTLSV